MKYSHCQSITAYLTFLSILFQLVPINLFADTVVFGTTGNNPTSIVRDTHGNIYTTNANDNTISKILPDGTSTTFATTGSYPYAMIISTNGDIYTSNIGDNTVSKILPDGTSTILGTTIGLNPYGITMDNSGNIYTSSYSDSTITKITPDGTSTTFATTGPNPYSITIDNSGNLYTPNSGDNTVSKILPDGTSTTFATTGPSPFAITLDTSGNIYTTNSGDNTVSKILPDGTSTTFATTGPSPYNITIDSIGNLYTTNAGNNTVSKITISGISSIFGTTGSYPIDILTDMSGAVYTSNMYDNTVSKISPDTSAPIITLYGSSEITLFQKQTYYDDGASCSDNVDGYCGYFSQASSGSVDTNTVGNYILEYSYTDQAGNTGKITRMVHIIADATAPDISLSGDNPATIYLGHTYNEQGAYCSDNADGYCGYLSQASSGSVDTNSTGTYILTYSFVDLAGNTGSTTRTVNVIADTIPPVITLNGDTDMTLLISQTYYENGASCYDNADDYCGYIVQASSGSVDTNTVGNYILEYSYTDQAGNTGKATRVVHVIPDTVPPDISLSGDNPTNIYKGHPYYEQGAYCSDNLDGYCGYISEASSGSVDIGIIGTYILSYTFVDLAGNTGSTTRTVNVIADSIPPTIHLYGNRMITIPVGATYNEPGAYCDDNADGYCGYISEASSGSVDTDNTGTYILTYSFADLAGNTGSTTRTVNVGDDITAPIITLNGGSLINHPDNIYYFDNGASAIDDDPTFDGNITITPNLSGYLPVGDHTITYTSIDPSGNIGTAFRSLHIGHPIPPTAYIPLSPTPDTTPMIQGTMSNDPTATINITINGRTYTGTNNGNGTWTLPDNTISPALTPGMSYNVTLRVTNIFGGQYNQTYNSRLKITVPTELSLHVTLENTGAIHLGDMVTYRYNIKNEGNNVYNPGLNEGLQLLSLVPDNIGLGNFVNQMINIPTSNSGTSCGNYGVGGSGSTAFGQRFAQYGNTHVLLCLALNQTIPVGGTYSFSITRPVLSDFPEGLTNRSLLVDSTSVDMDSALINTLAQDIHVDLFALQNNNISNAVYYTPQNTPTAVIHQVISGTTGPSGGEGGIKNTLSTDAMNKLMQTLHIFPTIHTPQEEKSSLAPSVSLNSASDKKAIRIAKGESIKNQTVTHPITENICTKLTRVYKPSEIRAKDLPDNEFREYIRKLISYSAIGNINNQNSLPHLLDGGIISNTLDFRGEQKITRAEYIKMLVRALSCNIDDDSISTHSKSSFLDVGETSEFLPYIEYATEQGWISGYPDGTFKPNALVSQKEALKILAKAIDLMDVSKITPSSTRKKETNTSRFITRQEVAKLFYRVFLEGGKE